MAASIWGTGWRAGIASLDPSIFDTENRGGGGGVGGGCFQAYVTDEWSALPIDCISCFTPGSPFPFTVISTWCTCAVLLSGSTQGSLITGLQHNPTGCHNRSTHTTAAVFSLQHREKLDCYTMPRDIRLINKALLTAPVPL